MLKLTRHRLSIALTLPLLGVMWLLFGWNAWNGDRDGYELYYTREISEWGVEVGYGYLNVLGNQLGLGFQAFQIAFAALTLGLLWRYLLVQTRAPFLSLLMYALCFFALDYVLLRNFLAFVIILQALVCLFRGGLGGRFMYVLLILLATTVHQSSFVYLALVIVPLQRAYNIWRFLFCLLAFYTVYVLGRNYLPLPASVSAHFDYYSVSLKSSLFSVCVHALSVLLMGLVVVCERRDILRLRAATLREREMVFVLNINLLSLFFAVLYFESEIFIRLLRTLVFINMLYCVNALVLVRRTYFFIFAYLLLFSAFLFLYFIWPTAELSLQPLFFRNLILG
ncbi:MAG: EpsG family protein [Paucimonas sp.]|jgi:hypothetical protein|nr:EpsG family protein [Paucimonas sp.]